MKPFHWFLFFAGAGGFVGFVLLVAEKRPLGGTIDVGEATIRR